MNPPKSCQSIPDTCRQGEEGVALILSLIFMIAMAILLAGMASRTHNQGRQVIAYVEYDHALQGLEAGFAMAQAELNGEVGDEDEDIDGLVGVDPTFDLSAAHPWFDDDLVTSQAMASMPGIEYIAFTYEWANDGIDNNGDGTTDEAEEAEYASVYSFARAPSVTRRAELILNGIAINIWRNAIFAGAGQSGNLINGNVSIHGSVHILGDDLDDGDVAVEALDLSGTSLIHNNYVGLNAGLRARVPALPTTLFGGETIETLSAELRVKNGLVGMSGNSEIGEPNVTGNTYKETMDGVYVTDGWTGTQIDADGNPTRVQSDNGYSESYDLKNAFEFPTYDNDQGRDHLAYYLETDANPAVGFQQVHTGNIAIVANRNYYWNATTGVESSNQSIGSGTMPTAASLDPNQYYIWFDAATNKMLINGRIAVDGNLTVNRGGGSDKTINYTGKGSILTYDADNSGNGGDVTVETDLLTVNANGTTAGSFPGNNAIGLMAQDDMFLGINSQLSLMGGFYAQDVVTLNKQSTIMGTIVGKSFNMGGQVPDIYQVPELVNAWNADMRIIGDQEARFYRPLSWRELGVL